MSYEGSCHCGAVAFSVNTEMPTKALSCNCSICRRKGLLLAFVPMDQFELKSGEDALHSYKFNTHRIEHQFCAVCGTEPFAAAMTPDGVENRAINLRCVPSINLDGLEIQTYDGASK
jgi:hypothetical protein